MTLEIYSSHEALMQGLADQVAREIKEAIDMRGKAALALPGGTTPAPFLRDLAKKEIDWAQVIVMPGDERFVPETSERSNTRLLKENFFIENAANAQLVPFIAANESAEAAAHQASGLVEALLPIDVLVVGMGEDMHTASLFPDSPDLPEAMAEDAPAVVVLRAENAGEARLSLSARALRSAAYKHVLIVGEKKRQAYENALKESDELRAPIRVVLCDTPPATVHYAN